MGRTPRRVVWGGEYPGDNVTDDPTSDGPGFAPQLIVPPPTSELATGAALIQSLKGNITTGAVGWLGKWKSTANSRRRNSWRANNLTADYRSAGGEGSITFGGTGVPTAPSLQPAVRSPFVRITTENATLGKSATASTNLGLWRWKWDPMAGWWTRTVTYTHARYYWALTSVTLDQIAPTAGGAGTFGGLGAGNRAVAFCIDFNTFVDNNWHALTWDGTTFTDTDTGVSALSTPNTIFLPVIEIDSANSQVRFYLYNRDDAIDHGLIETRTFTAGNTDVFGMQMVVEIAGAAGGALSLDGSEFFCEHGP